MESIENIELCADTYLPIAEKMEEKRLKELDDQIKSILNKLEKEKSQKKQLSMPISFIRFVMERKKLSSIKQSDILKKSFFLNLFSEFDAYIGDLIKCLFILKQDLMKSIDYSFDTKELIKCNSIKEMKEFIISKEVERIRRESYVEQFKSLENRFNLTLRDFSNWPFFVECSQRRNIITHCDGIVTEQYISVCKREGYKFEKRINVGDRLVIDSDYFYKSIFLFYEVGIKLGQVLWRKFFPDQIKHADYDLITIIYRFLEREKWEPVKTIGEFSINLHKHHNDENKRILRINYAQSYKWSGDNAKAIEVCNEVDWSSCTNEFQLAESIIKDDFKKAAELMIKIGKGEKLIDREAYHTWPLFREFRMSNEFLTSYRKIFRRDFSKSVERQIKIAEYKTSQDNEKAPT